MNLCAIIGCDFAVTFGGLVTSNCLRCGSVSEQESMPEIFYSVE